MPVHSFLRYQLQNSLRQLPASADLLATAVGVTTDTVKGYLAEFEQIRQSAVLRLAQTCKTEADALRGKRVLFFGDSLTADEIGYRVFVSEAAGLAARNAAISGATSSSLLPSCRHRIFSASSPTPEIISVMLGTNDAVCLEREDMPLVSLGEYLRNMRQILCWAQKAGARVLLFAIPSVLEAQFCAHEAASGKRQTNANIARYNEGLVALAREVGIPLISQDEPMLDPTCFEKDGLHWSVEGQTRFAARWLRAAADLK